jgi:hypothetical protein
LFRHYQFQVGIHQCVTKPNDIVSRRAHRIEVLSCHACLAANRNGFIEQQQASIDVGRFG